MLAAQLANGGFPQRYPKAKDYEVDITFNDGVTMGILNVLEDIAEDSRSGPGLTRHAGSGPATPSHGAPSASSSARFASATA